jgi:hypothetical protein
MKKSPRLLSIANGVNKEPLPVEEKRVPLVPPHLFKLHSLMAFIGSVGSGKTHEATKLTLEYIKCKCINQLYIISPTFEQQNVFKLLDQQKENLYIYKTFSGEEALKNTIACVFKVLHMVEESMDEYVAYLEYMDIYHKWERGEKLTMPEENVLAYNHYQPVEELEYPSPYLILDDLSHTQIYSSSRDNPFNNLCLRHRHYKECGITVIMLVQNFTNGVPKFLRQNIGQFFIFQTYDATNLKNIYEQIAGASTLETFLEVFEIATKEKHDFLTVDLRASNPAERFRKNFNEFLIVEEEESHLL